MDPIVTVTVATALFAALLFALLRPNKSEANIGDMSMLEVTGWDRLRPSGTAIFADMLASDGDSTYRFESFVVDDAWMKRLVGTRIPAEVVGEHIVRFRPNWDSEDMFDALSETMQFTRRDDEYTWALYKNHSVAIASQGDWISIDIELEWSEDDDADYLIEIEWLGDNAHVPLYADERHHGKHIVRLVDDAQNVYETVVEPRLDSFLELVDASSAQLVITPLTVTYSLDAAPCVAAADLALRRAFRALALVRGEELPTQTSAEW